MAFRSGRFVLLFGQDDSPAGDGPDWGYVTSWDTWEEAEVAFPIAVGYRLIDDQTGRVWSAHDPYEWEAAQT